MTSLKHWKERLRVRIIQPVDNRLWRFWPGSLEQSCLYHHTDFDGIARFHPSLKLDRLRTEEPAVHDYVLHRFTAYAYNFEGLLHIEPRMGWLVPKAFRMLEHSFPMVNDPWDATKPRPSTFQYLTRRTETTLTSAASVRYLWSNYYHFFFDTLPQFRMLDTVGVPRDVPVLVPSYVQGIRFVREFLELSDFLAGRELIVQSPDQYVRVLRHTYVTKDVCYPSAIFEVLGTLAPHLERTGENKVFVRRDPRLRRTLANDAEIALIAEQHGFTVVDTAGMSLREQMGLFAGARVVVGIHGAGLTNIIFRNRRPLTLLELLPGDATPQFYQDICAQFGYEYYRLLGGPLDADGRFHLDPVAFTAALRVCSEASVSS